MPAVASVATFGKIQAVPKNGSVLTNTTALPSGYAVAYVKCVHSGDTVMLCTPRNHSQTRNVSLAWLNCPRLAATKNKSSDQPFAFEARETLRRAIVGREIIYVVEYTVTASGRDFCTIMVKDSATSTYINVASILLAAGYARLRDTTRNAGTNSSSELENLKLVEEEARKNGEGLWDGCKEHFSITLHPTIEKVAEFLASHKTQPIRAVVEHVRDGSCIRARLMPNDNEHFMAWIYFSGIKVTPEEEDPQEHNAARTFTELRLLQRDVQIWLEAQDNNGILATVIHPKGNIAEFLLREGLARIAEWSLKFVSVKDGANVLREAEKNAQDNGRNTWSKQNKTVQTENHSGEILSSQTLNEPIIKGIVTRIISAEMIQVRSEKSGIDYRISFASIRTPRKDNQEVYVTLAREWLRSKLIGKEVEVTVDFIKPPQNEFEERLCSQVTAFKENECVRSSYSVSEALVRVGLAIVLRHKRNDDQRASNLDLLLAAEESALAKRKGIHAATITVLPEIKKISESQAKAKQYLSFMQRTKSMNAVVEHVISGSRIALLLPKDSMRFTMVLSGIRVPRQNEKWSREAIKKSNDLVMQRDVIVEVESLDMTAAFIGNLIINNESLAVKLVEDGLASVHQSGAKKNNFSAQLFEAEAKAKNLQVGIWELSDPEIEENDTGKESLKPEPEKNEHSKIEKKLAYIYISEYVSPFKFFIHSTADSEQFEEMMKQFGDFHASMETESPIKVKRGEIVSAKFSSDNKWYRAKILRFSDVTKTASVLYIDYGNSESIPLSSIRALPQQFSSFPPKAQEAVLSYLKQRDATAQFSNVALDRFRELTRGKRLLINIDKMNPLMVTLFDPETAAREKDSPIDLSLNTSINKTLLSDGCAILDMRQIAKLPPSFVAPLCDAFELAKEERRCIWQYGNIECEEESQN